MAQIAIAAGVPQGDLWAEARSRDTIGSIWFTKPLLRQHRVIVVTSRWHEPVIAAETWLRQAMPPTRPILGRALAPHRRTARSPPPQGLRRAFR